MFHIVLVSCIKFVEAFCSACLDYYGCTCCFIDCCWFVAFGSLELEMVKALKEHNKVLSHCVGQARLHAWVGVESPCHLSVSNLGKWGPLM